MFVCADGADGFLVSASGRDGPTLCYVARNAPGCMLATTQTVEGRKLSTLSLKDAPADFAPSRQSSRNAVDALHNLALMALSAELLGVMEKAQEITFDYLRIRKQFGKLIGSFQALQHQAVNIYIRTETTRSLVFQVAANNDPYRIDPALAVAMKAKASEERCLSPRPVSSFTARLDSLMNTTSASISSGRCCCRRCSGMRRRSAAAMSQSLV
jgi:alkylation response protein AidB-like acyl-CoA dehydrogenase